MSDRTLGRAAGIGALLGVAMLYSLATQAAGTPAATAPPASTDRADDQAPDPLSVVLTDFVGRDPAGSPRAVGSEGYRVRFVIATLPDPIDSHFASAFDRGLEAIVAAMSDAGYSMDRWSLPWRVPGRTEIQAQRSAVKPGRPILSATTPFPQAPPDAHRMSPGLVLFRMDLDTTKRELVVLFVVGETPTQGLQKEAFVQALRSICAFEERNAGSVRSRDQPLAVLAPYFSGSAESLRILLASRSGSPVTILSGSATSDWNKTVLGDSYHSTSRPDSDLMRALDDYFEEIHVTSQDVALLVEDGTAYGQDFARLPKPDPSPSPEADPSPSPSPSPGSKPQLVMRFPLQISQIRGAYERREAARRGTTPAPQLHRGLEISLEGSEDAADALPPYDSRMTASVSELVLANVFDTVRRRKVRYLGLVASDSRDVLFLARKAREYGSDANLFTFGADVLYQHPDALPYLDGLLVVTTYPLLSRYQAGRQRGAPGTRQLRRSFSGASEEGIYNAVVSLIDRCDLLLDYASPSESDGPALDEQPPVWIVANGRNGFWPVSVWSPHGQPTPQEPRPAVLFSAGSCTRESERHRTGWPSLPVPSATLVLFVAWSSATALLVVGYTRYRKRDSALRPDGSGAGSVADRLCTLFSRCDGEPHVFLNLAAMSSLFLVLSAIEGSITAQVRQWYVVTVPETLPWEFWGITLGGFALACGSALISLREFRGLFGAGARLTALEGTATDETARAEVRRAFAFGLVQLLLFAGFAALVAVFTHSVAQGSDHAFLLLNRSFNLGSRAGPLLPLCLGSLVLVLFTICQIRRSVLYEEQRLPLSGGQPPQSLLALLQPYGAFTRTIRNPAASRLACFAPFVGLGVFHALLVGAGWYRSFDGWTWNALATVLLGLCAWSVAWAVLEFREIWRRVSALLRILSWSPLADAFNRMPDGLAKSQWKMWRAPPTLTSLHVSVSHLKTLVSLGKSSPLQGLLDPEVATAQSQSDAIFTVVLSGANEGHASTRAQRKELRKHLALATLGVCRMLEKEWGKWPSKADIQDKSEKEQETLNTVVWLRRQVPSPPDVFVRIAEEYVAVRFVSFIHYAFSQLRNILSFALLGFLLLMALVGSYPFQPFHPVVAMAWVLGLFGIAGVVWTFIDMDRDLILSYIAKTRPGRVTLNLELVTNLFVYAVIPLLTLLATQFPDLGDWILSLLNPAMRDRY